VILFACIFGSQGAQAQELKLGVAGSYAGFFFRNASNLQDVKGRLAVGGDLAVHGTSIGSRVPKNSPLPSLLVGGSILAFDSGSIWAGEQINSFGLYRGGKHESVPAYLDLRQSDALEVDFDAERDALSFLSWQLRVAPATGRTSKQYATVTLTGSNQPVEIFNLLAEHVVGSQDLALQNVRNDAYIVLNVASDTLRSARMGITMTALKGRHQKVLFNFYDAQVLHLSNVQVWGSVLAPYACVCRSNGHIEGSVIADSWDSAMGIGYAPFVSMP
jgi:choice-of-anchor A domain-containing protein